MSCFFTKEAGEFSGSGARREEADDGCFGAKGILPCWLEEGESMRRSGSESPLGRLIDGGRVVRGGDGGQRE